MNAPLEMLEVVDENDTVIGLETRTKIHREGLLHREIHVLFLTPAREIIFQHRSKNKDTYPDKLDATVGGHVDPGMSYEDTAMRECREETGIVVNLKDLIPLAKIRGRTTDEITGLTNNAVRMEYAYLYKGLINELVVEKGKATGFEAWKINDLLKLSKSDKDKFTPVILSDEFLSLFDKIKKLLST